MLLSKYLSTPSPAHPWVSTCTELGSHRERGSYAPGPARRARHTWGARASSGVAWNHLGPGVEQGAPVGIFGNASILRPLDPRPINVPATPW